MIKEIKMPNLGTTTDEIKIIRWLKSENEYVARGEPLFEVETDKASMEVESYLEGYLKQIVVPADGTAVEGSVVAFLGEEDDVVPDLCVYEDEEPGPAEQPIKPARSESLRVSPLVNRIAENLGVDLSAVKGTGINGMILKTDVENAAKKSAPAAPLAIKHTGGELLPFSGVGALSAKGMAQSKSTIPHVYYSVDISPERMVSARAANDKRFSYNAMILIAVADAISMYPKAVATFTENGIRLPADINIGVAVDNEGDLYVPVVKNVDKKNVYQVEEDLKDLISRARSRSLRTDDLSGGVFTVSNLGGAGIDAFHAVIKSGESGILAVGRMAKVPVVSGEAVVPGLSMNLGLSQDHRVVNGAYSAAFLIRIKEVLEKWTIRQE